MGYPIDIIFPSIKKYTENKKYFNDEEWENIDIFFNSCTSNSEFPLYFDFSIHYPKADIVSKAIKEAGGKVFLAHVFRYKIKNHIQFINNTIKENIIDGIEVYHSSFSDKQIKTLEEYAEENKILVSGESDYHGGRKKNRNLGLGYGNLNISKDILNNW